MASVYYPAIIEGDGADGWYSVFFPDLDGCASGGPTLQAAARNAEEALELHLAGMIEDKAALPDPTPFDAIEIDADTVVAARILVRADLPGKLARVNVTFDEALLGTIDRAAEAQGLTRSGFLAHGARKLIAEWRNADARVKDSDTDKTPQARGVTKVRRDAGTGASGDSKAKQRRIKLPMKRA